MNKYYVHRDDDGNITCLTKWPNGSSEQLSESIEEVNIFLNSGVEDESE